MKKKAPIVLFVYNRLEHTNKTVEALMQNELAQESDLFIYSDGAKREVDNEAVNSLRSYLKTIQGFNKIEIIEREKNFGLAKSIVEGVSEVVKKYGKVIVVEDDIVTSPYFLSYMNAALDHFEHNKKVWHISGWTPGIKKKGLADFFFWRIMNCYGWGTWADRWSAYSNNSEQIILNLSFKDKIAFSLAGISNYWRQLKANQKGQIKTWAIFWYASIYKNNGLCLTPRTSFTKNIGFDGSGVHTTSESKFRNHEKLSNQKTFEFNNLSVTESKKAIFKVYRFFFVENIMKLVKLFKH
ncbi:MAG: glycosyltransferase [Vicingaceae bacterium]